MRWRRSRPSTSRRPERALELIRVDYEVLPSVFDPFEALDGAAPVIHDERDGVDGNVSMRWDFDEGDVDAAAAHAAVDRRGRTTPRPRPLPAPIETHVVIASFDADGHLTVWSPVHMVFMYRKELADCLGLDWQRITVIQPPVGGSFGGKIDIDPHDFIAVMLARHARRPVRLVMNREEEFIGTRTRQPIHIPTANWRRRRGEAVVPRCRGRVGQRRLQRVGLPRDARRHEHDHLACIASRTAASGARSCTRTRTTVARCAGFGNPQATFAVEQQMEELADALGIDPMDLRLRNANQSGDVTPQGMRITSCGLSECLRIVREQSGWGRAPGEDA